MASAFLADEGPFLAGAVSYQLFFALIPLLAVVIGVMGFVYGTERASAELAGMIRELYPGARAQEVEIVRQLVEGRALSLSLGLVGTFFAVGAVYDSIGRALAYVLGRGERRSARRRTASAYGFVLAIAALAVASFALSYGVEAAQDLLFDRGVRGIARLAIRLAGPLAGLAIGVAFFYLVYRSVPAVRVGHRPALRAALVSGVLWEAGKLGFAALTRGLGVFQVYGALAFAAGLLTWIYVTAAIILIGAEVIKTERTAS